MLQLPREASLCLEAEREDAQEEYREGDLVYVWRKDIGWVGPGTVMTTTPFKGGLVELYIRTSLFTRKKNPGKDGIEIVFARVQDVRRVIDVEGTEKRNPRPSTLREISRRCDRRWSASSRWTSASMVYAPAQAFHGISSPPPEWRYAFAECLEVQARSDRERYFYCEKCFL